MIVPDFNTLNSNNCTQHSIEKNYPEFGEYLKEHYRNMYPHSKRMYMFYNHLESEPVCPVCGKVPKFTNIRNGYYTYCSKACMNKSNAVKEHRRLTLQEHWGVDNPMASKEIRELQKKANLEKYGVENSFQREDVKTKIKAINLQKRGVEYPMQSKEVRDKSTKTIQEKYGVEWNCQRDEAKNGYNLDSKPNKAFEEFLKSYNIDFEREFPLEDKSFDFKIGNTLIEIDPSATHNSTWGVHGKEPTPRRYHWNKTQLAIKYGYRCIHVWDWDDKEKVIYQFLPKLTIGARQCELREISEEEINSFLNKYHFQNGCKRQQYRYGLYYKDELVQVMSFGQSRYDKKYDWELVRLCTHKDYKVVGGAERLFKHFTKEHSGSIVSYCDNGKFDGNIYKRLGFEMVKYGQPAKHWYKKGMHILNSLLVQRGYDQLFRTSYGKGISNDELMRQNKFVEVYDSGQTKWIWKSSCHIQ